MCKTRQSRPGVVVQRKRKGGGGDGEAYGAYRARGDARSRKDGEVWNGRSDTTAIGWKLYLSGIHHP